MPLPDFPSGINTELSSKPIPFKRPSAKRPRDPRRWVAAIFVGLLIVVALYPALRDWFGLLRR